MLPRSPEQACCLSRPDWGYPTAFGSAAKAEALVRKAAKRRKLDAQMDAVRESCSESIRNNHEN
jgi:hypothetical protein